MAKELNQRQQTEVIKQSVVDLLQASVPIKASSMVVQKVRDDTGIEVEIERVRAVLKDELGLGYRMAKKIPVQCNTERCLVLRQQYAMAMIPLLRA